ncbi:LOW QUALITY PROTEIN: reverse transcriptase [Phytophthora megakarya]|uniref:Reverse transcriptase n=1 Tax=Phytophthora megakarya TaxID=4795 RepID=A0A225VJL5_9STRA|nr:LOW QUALITY PROTEIN: reverse transcriptase [Phytophthora megakarya]
MITMPPPTLEPDENILVVSFDGSARVKRSGGAYSAVVWKLPEWTVVEAMSEYMPDLTVNEAEYRGLILGFDLLSTLDRGRVWGDSNLVILQMQSEMDCKAPGLQPLRQKALNRLQSWAKHEFLHVKREWNQSADKMASAALQREKGEIVTSEDDRQDLITVNRLGEMLKPKLIETVVSVNEITRVAERQRHTPKAMEESIIQRIRCQRIRQAQDEEWIADLKKYLDGEVSALTAEEAKACSKIAASYEVDENSSFALRRCSETSETFFTIIMPVWREAIKASEGRAGGSKRTFTGVGCIEVYNVTWGNAPIAKPGKESQRAKENHQEISRVISMDHIPSLPKSFKGNTELLIWADLFACYVIAKAGPSRETQAVENYEECAFRRFGASEVIRHDREPGFMSDFFRAFNRIVKMRQSSTMAYRPQRNKAERTVQTLTRALKMYVADVNQQDWDGYAERLTFALNTAHDRVRGEMSFFLVHGWDPRSTLEAVVSVESTRRRDGDARRWRYHIQGQYRRAREAVNENLREAIKSRADQHNENVRPHRIEEGTQMRLYLDRVKKATLLAHMWHGPFRVTELIGNHAARLETAGSGYRIFPIVHLSKLKPVRTFPDRAKVVLNTEDDDRVDIDEEQLPDDSWDTPLDEDEFEVERIADVRAGRRT